jgi:hypothetical protein
MLLETDIGEQDEAEESEGDDDDNHCDAAGAAMGSEKGQAVIEICNVAEEASEIDDSSSDGYSDADNGMGRKTGAARFMVESFADRCVVISVGKSIVLKHFAQRVSLGWLVYRLSQSSRCRCPSSASA